MKQILILGIIVFSVILYGNDQDYQQYQQCKSGYKKTMKVYRDYMTDSQSKSCHQRKKKLLKVMYLMTENMEYCFNLNISNAKDIIRLYQKYHTDLETKRDQGIKRCGWSWSSFENI